MSRRRLQALRNLAERPGTEAEGIAARAALKRHEAKEPTEAERWKSFESYLRTGSDDDLAWACSRKCDCGANVPSGQLCQNQSEHFRIRVIISQRFPRGTRVYYNNWAYEANQSGVVTGYPVKNRDRMWAWVRVKFDGRKSAVSIPAFTSKGWHLSTEPIDRETSRRTDLRGDMESQEDMQEAIARLGRDAAVKAGLAGDFGEKIREIFARL